MKVVLIYRQRGSGAYSIEGIFHTVAGELRKHVEVVEYEVGRRRSILLDAWRLWRSKADIYHITGDVNYFAFLLPRKKTVVTVHDIGHYLFDLRGIKRWLYKWLWLVFPVRMAGAVTTVSAATRERMIQHLDIAGESVDVIENCHDAGFKPAPKAYSVECPLILQVGTGANKNVPRLVEALQGLNCRLALIGRLDAHIKRSLRECHIDYENHADLTREDVYRQYVKCDVVSFISLNEGFGMPIIEAQAVGRPVITANIPPMCDVGGAAAYLVDPNDVDSIRNGITGVLGNQCLRDELVRKGFSNVTRYSPAFVANRYLQLYRKMTFRIEQEA